MKRTLLKSCVCVCVLLALRCDALRIFMQRKKRLREEKFSCVWLPLAERWRRGFNKLTIHSNKWSIYILQIVIVHRSHRSQMFFFHENLLHVHSHTHTHTYMPEWKATKYYILNKRRRRNERKHAHTHIHKRKKWEYILLLKWG